MQSDLTHIDREIDELLGAVELYNRKQTIEEDRVTLCPVDSSEIENFDAYPLDYQRFFERVGALNFSPGYAGLSTLAPGIPLRDFEARTNPFHSYAFEDLHFYDDLQQPPHHRSVSVWAEREGISDHIFVAEAPWDYVYFAYNTSGNRYTPVYLLYNHLTEAEPFLEFVIRTLDPVFSLTL